MFVDLIEIRLFDHTQLNDDDFASLQPVHYRNTKRRLLYDVPLLMVRVDFQQAINHIYFFRSQDAMSSTRQM